MARNDSGKDERSEALDQVRDALGKDTKEFVETHIRYRGPSGAPVGLSQTTESADDIARDIAPDPSMLGQGGHNDDENYSALDDKELHNQFPDLTNTELRTLSVVEPGTRLEQGGTYADLNDLGRGPFKAMGGEFATEENRYIAKRDVDYELWNRIVGQGAEPRVERPDEVAAED